MDKPKLPWLNANLPPSLATAAAVVLLSYEDVFACSYHDLKCFLAHLAEHKIELDLAVRLC